MAELTERDFRDPVPEERGRSPVAVAGFLLALAAAVFAALAGFGSRIGIWDFRIGFEILRWATYGALAAAAISLLGLALTRRGQGRRGLGFAAIGLVLGLTVAYIPWHYKQKGDDAPPIHDITTDTREPPQFQAILPLRADAPNPVEYGGEDVAFQQREAYPDIQPLALDVPPEEAFRRAYDAAEAMGWEIVDARPSEGRIEATDTTFWFGFKDDVVVRVVAAGGGSRIDVRSVSRVGRGDVGANAERVREYLETVRATT